MRIQILPLPSVVVGEVVEEPFALVIDQAEEGVHKELLGEFARQCGAKTFVIVPQTVEVVDRYAEPEPPKANCEMRISLPEDLDVEDATRKMRFALGLCPDCGERPCACPPPAPPRFDAAQRLQESVTAGWPRLQRDRSEDDD